MTQDLQSIFESITPDNIKDVPVIQDAMAIFIETLEELSKESIDIKNIYSNDLIREELIKIYLDDLYNVLQQIQVNQKIIDKIDSINAIYNAGKLPTDPQYEYISKDIITNISKYITDEHFMSFRSYKEKKGTAAALKYMYSLISSFVNSGDNQVDFTITTTGNPFEFNVDGPLPIEFYEYIIYPLAHPLGFTYAYNQYVSLLLQDYFPEEQFTYTVNVLEVRCLQTDGTTIVTDYSSRQVTKITNTVEGSTRIKRIYFDVPYAGEYLEQQTTELGQTTVYLKNETSILITFGGQCSIYFDYNFDIKTTVSDELSFIDTSNLTDDAALQTNTTEADSLVIGAGNEITTSQQYGITCEDYLVIGGSYLGVDQTIGRPWINPPVWLRIGQQCLGYDLYIGEMYIGVYQLVTINDNVGDSYFNAPDFDSFSDDDFTFGVYRNNVLLTDNNVSALP